MRTVKSAISYTHITEDASIPAQVTKGAGKLYFDAVKGKKRHNLGPPNGHMGCSIVTQIYSELRETDTREREAMMEFSRRFPGILEVATEMPVVRWGKTYEKKTRIVVGFGHTAKTLGIDLLYLAWMNKHGAEQKIGEAPRGPKERKVIELLGLGRQEEEAE
jgi:hypothetical protein